MHEAPAFFLRAHAQALDAFAVDDDYLTRLDVAQQRRSHYVERAGLRSYVVSAFALAEDEGLEAVRVARRDEGIFQQHGERIGALDPAQRVDERVYRLHMGLLRHHMQYGL